MFSFIKNLSLRTKIIGFNFIAIALIGTVGVVLFNRSSAENVKRFEYVLHSYVASLQAAIATQFFERYGDVQAFAINPDIKSNIKETIVGALNSYVSLYGVYDLIMVIDKSGNLVATNSKDATGKDLNTQELFKKNYANEKWFSETLKGTFTEDPAKGYSGTYFEEPQFDPNTTQAYGEKKWGNSFSAQIKDEKNEVIGVISNRANFKWVEDELVSNASRVVKELDLNLEMMVLNTEGYVLGIYNSEDRKEKYARVESELGIRNIYKSHPELSSLKFSDNGVKYIFDTVSNTDQLAAYTPINDQKWIKDIGWSAMVHVDTNEAFGSIQADKKLFFIELAVASLILTVLCFLFGNYISKQLSANTAALTSETQSLLENSSSMATTSDQLSSAAIEQAAALQQTVSAIDEVSAMVTKNAENARRSKEISQSSEKSALEGKKTMEDMLDVIGEIQKSNTEMMNQVKKSNEEFTNIVNVISEIGSKTKVINDIVFQTKLLSFNASVEAARAGVHGKGFAVVAEEVGNLAQMSGNASKEISVLLENSIVKVQNIVNETRTRVDKLVDISKEKVDSGTETAKLCSSVLDDIVTSVTQVNQMVEEISTASTEQAQGVSEITKAMNQLDQVTQQNTQAASVSSDTAISIKNKVEKFREVVGEINSIVLGKNNKPLESKNTRSNNSSSLKKSLGKVLPITKAKDKKKSIASSEELKKVSGDSMMPDKDDPRFEDV